VWCKGFHFFESQSFPGPVKIPLFSKIPSSQKRKRKSPCEPGVTHRNRLDQGVIEPVTVPGNLEPLLPKREYMYITHAPDSLRLKMGQNHPNETADVCCWLR